MWNKASMRIWVCVHVCARTLHLCICEYINSTYTHRYTYVKTHKHTCIPMLSQTPVQDSAGLRLAGDIHVIFYDYDMLSKPTKMFGFWVTWACICASVGLVRHECMCLCPSLCHVRRRMCVCVCVCVYIHCVYIYTCIYTHTHWISKRVLDNLCIHVYIFN